MTIDKSALKALAEAATPGPWQLVSEGIRRIESASEFVCESGGMEDQDAAFIAAANPATILALLAEIHSLECRFEVSEDTLGVIRGCLKAAEGDIDQLKTENESLRKDAERNNRMLVAAAITIGEICEALSIDNHSEPDMIVEAVRELKERGQ